jgi:dCTP diphosphatase
MPRSTNSKRPQRKEGWANTGHRAGISEKVGDRGSSVHDAFDELKEEIRIFARERDWDKYHSPKNLSMALAVEASELMEIFQWLTPSESSKLRPVELAEVQDEMGDVMIYLVRLADRLSISLVDAARKKLMKSKAKYPVEKAKGNAKKYTKL